MTFAVGVILDGVEGEADFVDAEFDVSAKADLCQNKQRGVLVEFVRDNEVLVDLEKLACEEREAAGGKVPGKDMDPGGAGLCGEVEPHGMGEINSGVNASIGVTAERLGIEFCDEMADVINFLRESSM